MRTLIVLTLSLCLAISAFTQSEEPPVTDLDFKSEVVVNSNLNEGQQIPLDWAQNSAVACFPGTRFIEFQGNHVFYRIQMPPAADMDITVTPKSKKSRINVYALRLGADNMASPPDISRAISCEAAYPKYVGTPNLNVASKAQTVEYMSIKKPYTILIAVAGAKDVLEGDYELKISTKTR